MRKLLILSLLLLTAIKIAATLARGPVPIELDASHYWRLSTRVISGDILLFGEPVAYRTPMYPWFLAVVRLFSSASALPAIIAIQGILSVASIWMAAHMAARITKLPWAFPLTLLAALPAISAMTFTAAILSETLFIFLLMLNLLAVLDYANHDTTGRAIWIACTFALTLLTRPIVLLLWIPHVVFLLFIHVRKRWRLGKHARWRVKLHHRLAHAMVAAGTVIVLIAPWLMRNQILFGKPMVTEFVGRNIWIVTFQDGSGAGLNLPATEAGQTLQRRLANVGISDGWRHTWTVSKALVASGLNDAQADVLMKQVSLDAIKSDPKPFAEKAFRRIVNFWRCAATDLPPQGPAAGTFFGQQTWQWSVPPVDWAIEHRWSGSVWLNTLLTAILGAATLLLIVNFPTRPQGLWLALIFSYFAIVTGVLEIPAYRYRMVIEPLVAMTVGAAVAVLLSWRRRPAKVLKSK